MSWKQNCYRELRAKKMFEDDAHSSRFKELVDCFGSYPFFTRGLCKCIYLSAWDHEHFCIMLETLTDLSLGKETNTQEMRVKGDSLAEEQTDEQYYIYLLSNAFLDNKPFLLDESVQLSEGFRYIVSRALEAAEIIDNI